MKFSAVKSALPTLKSAILAVVSAILLILAFPDFEFWFLAYIALVPLFFAVEREKASFAKSFLTGWIFGLVFFFGTCWWLTFAPITYGGIPAPIAYFLILGAAAIVGLFPALFAGALSIVLKKFGVWGILSAPFLWTAIEFLRFWMTGNNWNAIAYSQAFQPELAQSAQFGGIYLVGFLIIVINSAFILLQVKNTKTKFIVSFILVLLVSAIISFSGYQLMEKKQNVSNSVVIAVQPNVPMSSIKYEDWLKLRERHVELAETALQKLKSSQPTTDYRPPTIVIFPESPMNFSFTQDREFQEFLREFTARNNVQVLFNAAEPSETDSFYNSAVLVNERGEKIAQYDKIHLVPFGEYVPLPQPLAIFVPTMVGNFAIGKEYDIVPLGDVNAGIMICFESHFPTLSRQFVLKGADVLIEMTNDGYLGETPVLRQHLANAVFRAVETNRPVLRVTNVGITAYINERGEVLDATKSYTEDFRVWTISKSDGSQTFYVKYGDWFAWLCSIVSLALLFWSFRKRKANGKSNSENFSS